MIPVFQVAIAQKDTDAPALVEMSYLHMNHRFGPVTTARLLCGDTVERFARDKVAILGMVMKPRTHNGEPAL